MKTYNVELTKSYIIKINAKNENEAREFCELFTGDIQDISTSEDKECLNFEIKDIECKMNQTYEVDEINEENS